MMNYIASFFFPKKSTTRHENIESWRQYEIKQLVCDDVAKGLQPLRNIVTLGPMISDDFESKTRWYVNRFGVRSEFLPDLMFIDSDWFVRLYFPSIDDKKYGPAVRTINSRWNTVLLDTEDDPGWCDL